MTVNGQATQEFVKNKAPKSLELMLAAMLPVVKIDKSRYLVGAEVREVHLRGN
jgi:hypothetical protein